MNRSNATPRSFSTDQLRAALGDIGGPARPDYLPDIVEQAGRTRQRPSWTLLGTWFSMDIAGRRQGVQLAAVAFASVLLLTLVAAGAALIGSQWTQRERLGLPTTPYAWERIAIETPTITGRVASLAVGPRGLLAAVGGDEPARLAFSTNGRDWTLVPEDQHPTLSNDRGFGMPSLLGTDRGFLMLQLNEVWLSENGYDWQRLASATTDPDLYPSGPDTAVLGGPGLVAVGDDKAWYSVDGSDWSLAVVPSLPAEIGPRPEDRYGAMTGVTAAGKDLVAWGSAEVPLAGNNDEHLVLPLLWASHDGRTWVDVVRPEMDSLTAVTGGPHGFVATGQAGGEAAVWLSADGEVWERVAEGGFTSPVRLELNAASATVAGYVIAATDGECAWYPCPEQDVVIWTSADGRSWSSVPSDDRFTRSQASASVAWGSTFVIGGMADSKPVIWITDSGQ